MGSCFFRYRFLLFSLFVLSVVTGILWLMLFVCISCVDGFVLSLFGR